MKRSVVSVAAAALVLGVVASALAQSPAGMTMYVFSSGPLTIAKSALQAGAPSTQVQVPVGFFVIKHPKGNFLFDTGNNDKIINDPSYWGPMAQALQVVRTPDIAIDTQLKKIGLTPNDIKYVAVGHMHLDHGGNVCKFPNAVFLVQRDEMKNAAWPEPGTAGPYIPGDVACLRNGIGEALPNKFKMDMLDGDLDVFGDKSVEIKRWPGHTPGSQMVVVRLPKTGTVVLTSDVVYLKESLEKNLIPPIPGTWSPMGMYEGYQKVRAVRDGEGAQVFFAHDPEVFKATKQAPQYYE